MASRSRWALVALLVVTFALLLVISRAYSGFPPPPPHLSASSGVPVGCASRASSPRWRSASCRRCSDGDRFADDGLRVVLLCGQCSEGFLRTALEPRAAAAIRRAWADEATRAASLTARSVVIEHGDPCGMRRWSTGRPRWVISRTMSEGDPSAEAVRCCARRRGGCRRRGTSRRTRRRASSGGGSSPCPSRSTSISLRPIPTQNAARRSSSSPTSSGRRARGGICCSRRTGAPLPSRTASASC